MHPGRRGDAPVAAALVEGFAPGLCLADAAYDSDALRAALIACGATPVIPNNPTRKRKHPFDRMAYRLRNAVERTFCRSQGLAAHRNPIRQTRKELPPPCYDPQIVSYWL